MDDRDHQHMENAVRQARSSLSEVGRIQPKVGVVVADKLGKLLGTAYRGENQPKEHAEYIALERKLHDESLVGATIYTTLEACTTRNHPKVPCAQWIIDRNIKRVVVGMLDPNFSICGNGVRTLRKAGIAVELFPTDLMAEVEEIGRAHV